MKTQQASTFVGGFESRSAASKSITATHHVCFGVIHVWVGALIISVSSAFAVAGDPPEKPTLAAKPAISTKQQAKLDAIHARRKAVSRRKHSSVTNRLGSPASPKATIRATEAKMIPNRAAAMAAKQSIADQLQLLQQQPTTAAEQAIWNQQRQILLMELSRQGMMPYGPNGPIVPGDGLPAFQIPSFSGLQIPSFGGLQVPSLGGLQMPRH
jgi:hypothetical protein